MSGRIVTHRSRGNYTLNYYKRNSIPKSDNSITNSDRPASPPRIGAIHKRAFVVEARSLICALVLLCYRSRTGGSVFSHYP